MSKISDTKYLLFDLGNVFVNWDKTLFIKTVAKDLEPQINPPIDYEDEYWGALRSSESKLELGHIDWLQFCAELSQLYAWSGCSELLLISFKEIFSPNLELIEWFQITNFSATTILVSNTNEYHWDWMVENLPEFVSKFDYLHLSHLVSARKPGIEFYKKIRPVKDWGKVFFCDDIPANLMVPKNLGATIHQFKSNRGVWQDLRKFAF